MSHPNALSRHNLHDLSFETAKIFFAQRYGNNQELTPTQIAHGLLEGYREAEHVLFEAWEKGDWAYKVEENLNPK